MKLTRAIILAMTATLVTGCVEEGEETPRFDTFVLEDSYGELSTTNGPDTALRLNPYILDGEFIIRSKATSKDSHYYSLGISQSRDSEITMIYDTSCGSDPEATQCDNKETLKCHYTSDLTMYCGVLDAETNTATDISGLLDTIPMIVYLRASICRRDLASCDSTYQVVELL